MQIPFLSSRLVIPFTLLALFAFLAVLMLTVDFSEAPFLGPAITADLLFTVPIIYYLLIRKTNIPKTTVVPVLVAGLVLGFYLLPAEQQFYLQLFKQYALPLVELVVIAMVVFKVRQAVAAFKQHKNESPDFFSTLKVSCAELLPRPLVLPMATELAVIYYALFRWKTSSLKENEFSLHKKSGTPALMGALGFLILIETVVLHILLAQWSTLAAWILSILSLYTALQLMGFAKSLAHRPVKITQNSLLLRYGIMHEVAIPFDAISTLDIHRGNLPEDTKRLALLGELEPQNLLLHVNSEYTIIGLYGFKKRFTSLAFHLDEPETFLQEINCKLNT